MEPNKKLFGMSLAGPGNQYCGLKESLIIAHILKCDLILPVFIPHGTVRNNSRSSYNFTETFDEKYFIDMCHKELNVKVIPCPNILDSYEIVNIRGDTNSKNQALEYLNFYKKEMKLSVDTSKIKDIPAFFDSPESIKKWYQKTSRENITIILGIFNSIKLGGINTSSKNVCTKNHCINCSPNLLFYDIYNKVNKVFKFSKIITDIGDKFISDNYGKRPFLAFHLRICDLPRNRTFAECYSGYTQEQVKNALINICSKYNINQNDIFLATPPQLFTSVRDLKEFKKGIFKTYNVTVLDGHLSGLVEQYICSISKVFVRSYTNMPDVARKPHDRSSWAELVDGIRRSNNLTITIDDFIH